MSFNVNWILPSIAFLSVCKKKIRRKSHILQEVYENNDWIRILFHRDIYWDKYFVWTSNFVNSTHEKIMKNGNINLLSIIVLKFLLIGYACRWCQCSLFILTLTFNCVFIYNGFESCHAIATRCQFISTASRPTPTISWGTFVYKVKKKSLIMWICFIYRLL